MERAEVAQEAGLEEAGLEVEAKAEAEAKAAGWEPSRTCSRWQPPRHEERQRAVAHRRKHTPTTRHTRCRGYQFGSPEGRAARRAAGGGGSDEVPAGEERRGDAEEEPLCAKLM